MKNMLETKIDFAVVISVKNANPNGDPLNGNRPRQDFDGYGEISDVAIKRKIRNRLQDMGEKIFVQSNDKNIDGYDSLKSRAESKPELCKKITQEEYAEIVCKEWIDVRSFGQVFAFKIKNQTSGLSVGVRGPVSIHTAKSIEPITISSMQITKSVKSDLGNKGSDTMGMKHRVDFVVYQFFGSINVQLAEKTGFTTEDAQKIKDALCTLFVNDTSSARPDGSMVVEKVIWWEHNTKLGQYPSAKVHQSLKIKAKTNAPKSFEDYEVEIKELDNLKVEVIDGQ